MEELIKRAQKGDKQAFTEIILCIRNDLYKIAKTRITNDDDIDDLIQDTMIETYKHIRKLKDNKKLKTWVIKILINKCNKLYKKRYMTDISIDEYNLYNYAILNSNKEIEDDLNFYYLIKNLKYEERIIIILYYKELYTVEEISKILKMNKNTVKTHLSRAREKIKLKFQINKEVLKWEI